MLYQLITEEELRRALAEWMLRNARTAPPPRSEAAEAYLLQYVPPETDFIFTQSYVNAQGKIITHWKATVHLNSWQTRGGKEALDFVYYKILSSEAERVNEGEVMGYILLPQEK